METSKNKNSNVEKVLENKDTHEVKFKNEENINNEIGTSQSKENNIKKPSINKNIQKVENEKNKIETLQNKDSNVNKALNYKDKSEVESKDKNIKNEIETSQYENSDVKEASKNKDESEIKSKDEDIRNEIETSQNENSDVKKASKNGDKILQTESEDESEDEGVEEEYCSDVTYLARKMASAERLNQSDSIKLYNLHVQLRHKVPPQHKIETRAGSHIPTRKEMEEFEKIIPIKKGSYSAHEDDIIANNWNAFCKLHNWNVERIKPFLQLRIGRITYMRNTTERRKFVQFLADGLPNRTLYSVYHRFRNLYEDNLQRRYKPEEDEMIIDHLENNPSLDEKHKYVDLAKVLRRTRNSIWRRYQILKRNRKKRESI